MARSSKKEANHLGGRIKELRGDRGLTQDQAAKFFGVSTSTISRLEAGKSCGFLNRVKIEKLLPSKEKVA